MATDIAAIEARRDWREGRDLSPFEVRLDDECLARHYAEDVTFLLAENDRLCARLAAIDEIAMSAVNEHETPVMRLAMIARLTVAEVGER